MSLDTLKQWMSSAGLDCKEGSDGYLLVVRGNLEFSATYLKDADLVACFSPLIELSGLNDAQRLKVLTQSLELNGVGSLPPCCSLSHDVGADVIYLLWQQPQAQLDSASFEDAFADFGTAAEQAQEILRGVTAEGAAAAEGQGGRDFMIQV